VNREKDEYIAGASTKYFFIKHAYLSVVLEYELRQAKDIAEKLRDRLGYFLRGAATLFIVNFYFRWKWRR
jgi:hypothetical protein